jgi:protein involved in polysaccharide export with SLBB domain
MTLEDLILQAGGLLESASTVRIDVSRRIKNPDSTTQLDSIGQVFTFALKDGYAIDGELLFSLQPYDQVFVRRSPGYFEQTHVTISGEVIFPGNYVLTHKTERISDLVKKAGGVNSWAYVKGARLQRKMNEDEKRRVESTLEVLDSAKDSINVENLDLAEYYYVGIDLEQALAKPGSDMDLVLREGDQLFVPEYINTVKISGNVMYPNTVTYNPEYLVSDYVEMAGGYGYHSKKSKAYIIYMNGNVTRARKFSKDVIEPGCEIVIPQKRQRDSKLSEIMSIATTSSSLATMFATLGNIIMSMKP